MEATSWRSMAVLLCSLALILSCASAGPPPASSSCTATTDDCKAGKCKGWVTVKFDISPNGTVRKPRILRSCPPGYFDSHVLDRLSSWKYHPSPNGKRGVVVSLDFELPAAP